MVKTTDELLEELNEYSSPKSKLSRMVKSGQCVQVIRGLYETNSEVSPYLLAGCIYGPSYISFDFALSVYGLIPEKACVVTSASFEKKKKKKYDTPFGTFTYRDVPSEAFPHNIVLKNEDGYWYRIAELEKALCDKLYTVSPVANVEELSQLLFDDLRIDVEEFRKLRLDVILELSEKYHSTNVKKLCTLVRRMSR